MPRARARHWFDRDDGGRDLQVMRPPRITPVLLLLLGACRAAGPPAVVQVLPDVAPPPAVESPVAAAGRAAGTYTAMRNVRFRLDPILALDIVRLTGLMRPVRPGHPIYFDDPHSLTLAVADADVGIDTMSLARLMNRYVFGFAKAPLTDVHFAPRDSLLEVRGMLHAGVTVPFTILATVGVTDSGFIRLHPVDVNLGAMDVDWFMRTLGIHLEQLVETKHAAGLRMEGNDMVIDPTAALPPPRISGPLTSVRVTRTGLMLRFHDAALLARLTPAPRLPVEAPNYMFFRGGVLHFGKLFMPDADMEIVDSVPGDWFDFFLAQYQRQLVAGHSETLRDYGLRVVMVDYSSLVRRAEAPRKGPARR